MSEASDALVLVVSEETGAISVARGGTLKRKLTNGELLEMLSEFVIGSEEEKPAKIKNRRRKSDEKD